MATLRTFRRAVSNRSARPAVRNLRPIGAGTRFRLPITFSKPMYLKRLLLLSGIVASLSAAAPLTIEEAVTDASQKYPGVHVSLEQVNAAAAAVNLARTAWLPRADLVGQVNRATHNNVFGMIFPTGLIPSISGPVLRTNSLESVWGSAVGVMVQWEPFDFGLRQANLAVAEVERQRAAAQVAVTRLQAATATADACLSMLAAQETVKAANAGVQRARVLDEIVVALVKSELRPGAEASRSHAELAAAETQVIQAEQAVEVARAALSQFLGVPPGEITIAPGKLLDMPPEIDAAGSAPEQHPAAVEQSRAVEEVKAQENALDRSWRPKFNAEGALYARGTGVQPDGTTGNAASGLGPNIQNWGVGLSVTFPLFEISSIRARKEVEHYRELSEEARYRQTLQDINAQTAKAKAMLDGARRVALHLPAQLEAARATERQATARYQAGLGNLVDVAEAQRLRTQTEIEDSLSRLAVWRALLGVAAARGDLTGFLQSTR